MKPDRKKRHSTKSEPGTAVHLPPEQVVYTARQLGESLCAAEGMELIHVEYQREPGGWVLRLFIEKQGGVTIDDCAVISQQLGDLLDIKLGTDLPYTLEVSSPGPERPLSKKSDFTRFAGLVARIRTRQPLGGQKNFKGVLAGMVDEAVQLTLEHETVAIPYQEITKARLVNYHGDDKC